MRIGSFSGWPFRKTPRGLKGWSTIPSAIYLERLEISAPCHCSMKPPQCPPNWLHPTIAAGFVHGVLNSDNINSPAKASTMALAVRADLDEDFVAAYFDQTGLYAFGRQPEAIHWNLAQLGGCLALIADGPALAEVLGACPARFEKRCSPPCSHDWEANRPIRLRPALISALLTALRTQSMTIDRFFFEWRGGRIPSGGKSEEFSALRHQLEGRAAVPRSPDHAYWSDREPCSMHIEEVEDIWAAIAERDDWQPFNAKIAAIRRMGDAMASPCV